jgi:integrase
LNFFNNEALPIPFAAFSAELMKLYEPPLRAKSTCRGMRHMLAAVAEELGEAGTTAGLTPDLVGRLVAARTHLSPHSVKGLLRCLKTACNYALQMGYLRSTPFAFRKQWVRTPEPSVREHHSREEIARVLDLMARDVTRKDGWAQWRARRLHALAATVAFTGMRRMEALYLKVEDVLLDERMILIVSRPDNRLKTPNSAQPVPIPDALHKILNVWLPDTGCEWAFPNVYRTAPWTGGSPGYKPLDRMKRLGKRAGVAGFTFMSLRHSWATHAEYWGLSEAMIQRVLRHTSPQTQRHYRHADATNMRAALGDIDFGPAPGSEDSR